MDIIVFVIWSVLEAVSVYRLAYRAGHRNGYSAGVADAAQLAHHPQQDRT